MESMIDLTAVAKAFGEVRAVDGVDLDVECGEVVALLGPSGCGKTTLLRLIAGFESPDGGSITLGGRLVAGRDWVPPERRRVGMVFQDYALFPHLTVEQNVGFGLPRRTRQRGVAQALDLVGLAGHGHRYPHEVSGGQQQRVALARALAPEPDVVLLDEPWSSVDPQLRASMREEVAGIVRGLGTTVVLVTHEQEEAFSLADRVALMSRGRIVQFGPPEEIYFQPATRWAAGFVGAANLVPGTVTAGRVETPLGTFTARNANGHASVDALVRPELLELLPDPAGPAEVISREFRGHDVFYGVRLADGTLVHSHRPSTEVVPLGARVSLRLHEGSVTVF